MQKPPVPKNEPQRLQCLLSMSILDTPPEERFDRLTRIAQGIFGVPIVLVSLIDKERQWFKSKQGIDLQETSRDISFCGHAILNSDLFYVNDALQDERFSDNPLVVGPPNIRFYAGMPLSGNNGDNVGTFCLIDTKPRLLNEDEISMLRDLADCVEDELVLSNKKTLEERVRIILDNISDGVIILNENAKIESMNKSAERMFGYSDEHMKYKSIESIFSNETKNILNDLMEKAMGHTSVNLECKLLGQRSDKSLFDVKSRIISTPIGRKKSYTMIIRDVTLYNL